MTEQQFGTPDNVDDMAPVPRSPVGPRRVDRRRVLVYGVLPGVALLMAMAAGLLKGQDASERDADIARAESVRAAKDAAVALLSYRADTIEKDVAAARSQLTGSFSDAYFQHARDVLIPHAKEKGISVVANVPAAASASASQNTAVVLVFVDQTVTTAASPPAESAMSVRVTLDKVGGRWLVSKFETV